MFDLGVESNPVSSILWGVYVSNEPNNVSILPVVFTSPADAPPLIGLLPEDSTVFSVDQIKPPCILLESKLLFVFWFVPIKNVFPFKPNLKLLLDSLFS